MRLASATFVLFCVVTEVLWGSRNSTAALFADDHILVSFKSEARHHSIDDPGGGLHLPPGSELIEPAIRRVMRRHSSAAAKPRRAPLDPGQFFYLRLPPELSVRASLRLLRNHPLLEYAEPDWITTGAASSQGESSERWHLQTIQLTNAWQITQGSSNIIAAVLDSGLADLPQFTERAVPGYNFAYTNSNTLDDHGHGTRVTAVLASVDAHCRIMPVKVFDSADSGLYSWWAQGIDYAVSNGCKIINLSAAGTEFGRTVQRAVTNAIAHGVIFVTSAGNLGSTNIGFPGYLNLCITVGATDRNDLRARFSNSGAQLDLVAPGVEIATIGPTDELENVQGTSFSAPLVSGVCALLASLRPDLTQADARLLLCAGAEDRVGDGADTAGFDNYYGWGRLNAFHSLILATTRIDSIRQSGISIEFSWTSPADSAQRRPYRIQWSDSLTGSWQPSTNGTFRYETNRTTWTSTPFGNTSQAGFFHIELGPL